MINETLLGKQEKKAIWGFTLIELLVVISIIGLLSTMLMANLNSMRERARDAERESDLKNTQTALRLYYNDFNKYPNSGASGEIEGCGSGGAVCSWGGEFAVNGKDPYMSVLPGDPSSDRVYVYTYVDDDTYTLQACLENESNKNCGNDCTVEFGSGDTAPDGCIYTVQP